MKATENNRTLINVVVQANQKGDSFYEKNNSNSIKYSNGL